MEKGLRPEYIFHSVYLMDGFMSTKSDSHNPSSVFSKRVREMIMTFLIKATGGINIIATARKTSKKV